jgi:hypothetical protein
VRTESPTRSSWSRCHDAAFQPNVPLPSHPFGHRALHHRRVGGGRMRHLGRRAPRVLFGVSRVMLAVYKLQNVARRLLLVGTSVCFFACGGRSELATNETLPSTTTNRVVAISDGSTMRVVTFADLAAPRTWQLPQEAFGGSSEAWHQYASWSPDGSGLFYWYRWPKHPELTQVALVNADDWTREVRLGPRYDEAFRYISHNWLGNDAILQLSATDWTLFNREGQGHGSSFLDDSDMDVNEAIVDPRGWIDRAMRTAVVPEPDGYIWLDPAGELGRVPRQGRVWTFEFPEHGDRLVAMVQGDEAVTPPEDPRIWVIRSAKIRGCVPLDEDPWSCFPRVRWISPVPNRDDQVILLVTVGGADIVRTVLLHAAWGEDILLEWPGAAGGAQVIWDSGDDTYMRWMFIENNLWIISGNSADTLIRVEFNEAGPLAPRVVLRFDPRREIGWRVDGRWLSPRSTRVGDAVHWDVLDLRTPSTFEWSPTPYVGELARPLGSQGLLFFDLRADPDEVGTLCEPCSFLAVENVNNPASRTVRGTFVSKGTSVRLGLSTPKAAPDGSGVLIRDKGTLFYETFEVPGSRFPVTAVPDDAYITLPPAWGKN